MKGARGANHAPMAPRRGNSALTLTLPLRGGGNNGERDKIDIHTFTLTLPLTGGGNSAVQGTRR